MHFVDVLNDRSAHPFGNIRSNSDLVVSTAPFLRACLVASDPNLVEGGRGHRVSDADSSDEVHLGATSNIQLSPDFSD